MSLMDVLVEGATVEGMYSKQHGGIQRGGSRVVTPRN